MRILARSDSINTLFHLSLRAYNIMRNDMTHFYIIINMISGQQQAWSLSVAGASDREGPHRGADTYYQSIQNEVV